jgi:sodium-dependent phosphate cotransporter
MFNFLSVMVMLPIEVIVGAITGSGGLLYHISDGLTSGIHGTEASTFKSPIKIIVSPYIKKIISVNKNIVKALSTGEPTLDVCLGSAEKPKIINKVSYTVCGDQAQLDESLAAWQKYVVDSSIIKGGWFEGTNDELAGTICLVVSLVILCLALFLIVLVLKKLVLGSAGASAEHGIFAKVLHMNGYLAIFVGMCLTIAVQSSSIITSAFTPLVGLGTLPLTNMLAFSLGANVGTTCTGLLAALVAGTVPALQIALCHLLFNIIGTLIWYPVPIMRNVPLRAASGMGYLTCCFRWWPVVYVLVAFFLVPLVLLGISSMLADGGVSAGFGWFLVVLLIVAFIAFGVFYQFKGGKEKIMAFLEIRYENANQRFEQAQQDDIARQKSAAEIDATEKGEAEQVAVEMEPLQRESVDI